MTENYHAVIIGINKYSDSRNLQTLQFAEKDAHDLYETLAKSGNFPQDNIKIVCGQDAKTHNLETILFTEVVKQRRDTDTVLVYFSGHGFVAGEVGKAYLGSWDVSIEEILANPNAGLRMDYLHDEIFMRSPSERIIFILDACHSGAFIPPSLTELKDIPSRGLIGPGFFSKGIIEEGKGRIAIVSSPKGVPSRESSQLKNGIFTYFLIKGLKGEAAEDNGEVTIDSLLAYMRRRVPCEQPPGRYGQDYGRFVITKVRVPPMRNVFQIDQIVHRVDLLPKSQMVRFPSNPLDLCIPFVTELVRKLEVITKEAGIEVANSVLDVVCSLFKAKFAFVLRIESEEVLPKFQSRLIPGFDPIAILQAATLISRQAVKDKVFAGHHGILHNYQKISHKGQKHSDKYLFIIPLSEEPSEFIVIADVAPDSILGNDIFAIIMKSLYFASLELTSLDLSYIEERIIDDLKLTYNFVPLNIYNRRFTLFTQRLSKALIQFQPVLYLDPDFLHVSSWEALARVPELIEKAPSYLFSAAELWGPQFTIELDKRLIWLATTGYREALSRVPGLKRVEDIQELSVNVYPQSLIRDAYYKVVSDIIKQKIIPAQKLILEISEKAPIPDEDYLNMEEAVRKFRIRLARYAHDFQIGFAIDDFGIGYGSVSRLLGLSPSYVKIDRSILLSEHSQLTLSYILSLVTTGLQASKVVIEGYDEEVQRRLTFRDLYKIGIRHIQGYLVGKAGPDLYRLDKSLENNLRKLFSENVV
jgi:EAL domain-containing protein (putative c-di-GMP-specific phosphodiesterase class I)